MKILRFLLFIVVGCLADPHVGLSSYAIRLTSGAEFITSGYWEEENQIKFYAYGGVMGIARQLVSEISDSDKPVGMGAQESIDKKGASKPGPTSAGSEDDKGTPSTLDSHRQVFLKEKARLASAMESAVSDFRTAKEQNDREAITKKRKEILSLKTELSQIESEVKKRYGGKVPDWWRTEKSPEAAD